MGRYAKRLSAVGFALVVWHIYSLGRSLWIEWAFEQRHGLGEFPHPLTLALGLVSIVLDNRGCGVVAPVGGPRPQRGCCALAGPAMVRFGSLHNRLVCIRHLVTWQRNSILPLHLLFYRCICYPHCCCPCLHGIRPGHLAAVVGLVQAIPRNPLTLAPFPMSRSGAGVANTGAG